MRCWHGVSPSADILPALPVPVRTTKVSGELDPWTEPLQAAGVNVDPPEAPDLLIAPASRPDGLERARAALLVGRAPVRRLRSAGFETARILAWPSTRAPALVLPLDDPVVVRYALRHLSVPRTRLGAVRNRLVAEGLRSDAVTEALCAAGVVPGSLTIASREGTLPFLVGRARAFGVSAGRWVLVPARGSGRASFHLFEPDADEPSFVLKFGPPSLADSFRADERGLALAHELGDVAATHVPRQLGRTTVEGTPMSLETAAPGTPLVQLLRGQGNTGRKRALVEEVAGWLVELGARSRGRGIGAVLSELAVPTGLDLVTRPATDSLAAELADVPTVLEHGELGLQHVIVGRTGFVVIDWESAGRGLPLADLAFLLVRALPLLDGDDTGSAEDVARRVFSGSSPSSPAFFRWLRQGAEAADVPVERIGPLLSAIWLRYADAHRAHFARAWFSDPKLGTGWICP